MSTVESISMRTGEFQSKKPSSSLHLGNLLVLLSMVLSKLIAMQTNTTKKSAISSKVLIWFDLM